MDNDDVDYFPRRKNAEDAKAAAIQLKKSNIATLHRAGLVFTKVKCGDVCVFRCPGRPTIDFYPQRCRWRVRGQKKTTFGTINDFIVFIKQFHRIPEADGSQLIGVSRGGPLDGALVYQVTSPTTMERTVDVTVTTTRDQAANQALRNLRENLGKHPTEGERLESKFDVTGTSVSSVIPNDFHVFDAAGNDLGRANVLIKSFVVHPDELISQAIARCLKPGQTLRIVHGG